MLRNGPRRLLSLGVAVHPTAKWIARQITGACGWDQPPRYIIHDRDRVYGDVFIRRLLATSPSSRSRQAPSDDDVRLSLGLIS
jgi:hypothetical protein